MKHCLYIHQDYQPQKLSQYPRMKYLVKRTIFHKFYVQKAIIKPCRMYFTRTCQLTTFVGQLMIFMAHALISK